MTILNYISENKEWIFSGIGIFCLGLFLTIIQKVIKRKIQTVDLSTKNNNIQAVRRNDLLPSTTLSNITVKEIIDEIHAAPPFQRD